MSPPTAFNSANANENAQTFVRMELTRFHFTEQEKLFDKADLYRNQMTQSTTSVCQTIRTNQMLEIIKGRRPRCEFSIVPHLISSSSLSVFFSLLTCKMMKVVALLSAMVLLACGATTEKHTVKLVNK